MANMAKNRVSAAVKLDSSTISKLMTDLITRGTRKYIQNIMTTAVGFMLSSSLDSLLKPTINKTKNKIRNRGKLLNVIITIILLVQSDLNKSWALTFPAYSTRGR